MYQEQSHQTSCPSVKEEGFYMDDYLLQKGFEVEKGIERQIDSR